MCIYIFICCSRAWFYGVMWTFECMHVLKKKKKTNVKHEVKGKQVWKDDNCEYMQFVNKSCKMYHLLHIFMYTCIIYKALKQGSWRLNMALFKLTFLVERALDPLCEEFLAVTSQNRERSAFFLFFFFRWSRSC